MEWDLFLGLHRRQSLREANPNLCVGYTGGFECQRARTAILPGDLSQLTTQGILKEKIVVAGPGLEPGTHGFSVRCSTN